MKKKIAIVSLIIFLIGLSYWSLSFTLKKESVKVANILNNYTGSQSWTSKKEYHT